MQRILRAATTLRLKLKLKLRPTMEAIKEAVDHSMETAVTASSVLASKRLCPSREVVEGLARRGLYEPILSLASSGCHLDSPVVMDAFRFLALEGAWDKAWKAASMVGLRLPEPQSIVLYCSRYRRIIDWDGFIIDSKNLPRDAVSRILINTGVEGVLPPEAWGSVVIKWGCQARGFDGKRIARIVAPDIPASISSVAYHLQEDPSSPTKVIRRLASFFLEIGDKVWLLEGTPPEYRGLEVFRGISRIAPKRCVIITDRPRAGMPILKPYKINIEEVIGARMDEALLALRMLEARSGDPARAYYYSKSYGEAKLASLIAKTLTIRKEPEPLPPCIQVEPQDLGWLQTLYPSILDEREVIVDCIKPTIECLRYNKFNVYEMSLVKDGIHIPKPKRVNGRKIRATARYMIPESVSSITGVTSSREDGKIKAIVAGNGAANPLSDIRASAMFLGGHGLVIVPNRIGIEMGKSIGLRILDEDNVDEWIDSGEVAVATWDLVKDRPDILYSSMGSVVSVYPEATIRSDTTSHIVKDNGIDALQILEDSVVEMISKLGGITVSRTARFMDNVEMLKIDKERDNTVHVVDKGVITEEMDKEFKKLWGEGLEFRRHQRATLNVLASLYSKMKHGLVLSIYPTGSGKSAIYQVAGRVATASGYGGYTLVVSPLKSLMNDQVSNAVERGLIAYKIDSTLSRVQRRIVIDAARKGLVDLLYVTPERFQDPELEELMEDSTPSLIVLDEAHTLSSWGNTFRPSYLYMAKRIYEYTLEKKWPPIALFTATAPHAVAKDILESLGVEEYEEYEADPDKMERIGYRKPVILKLDPIREELVFDVEPTGLGGERLEHLAEIVRGLVERAEAEGRPWIGVVFTGYVKSEKNPWANVDTIAEAIRKNVDTRVEVYHGQMSNSARRRVESEIKKTVESGGSMILVATKAFGMGVDIPVIRWIVHAYPSDSPEDYYQEAGRAGRDGRRAWITTMYNPVDFEEKKRLALMDRVRPSTVIQTYNTLARLVNNTRYKGKELVILPVGAIAGGPTAIKILDILRGLGLLDYWITQAELAAYTVEDLDAFDDYSQWYWRLDKHTVISHTGIPRTRLWRKEKLRIEACTTNGAREIRIEAGNVVAASGPCTGATWEYNPARTQVAIIEFPIRKPKEITVPGKEDFVKLVKKSTGEIESIDNLKEMLEKALAAKSVGGPQAADRAIKEWIRNYFTYQPGKEETARISGKRRECTTIDKCIEEVIQDTIEAAKVLGRYGVTLAVKDQDIAYRLKQELASRGVAVEPSIAAYRRILGHSTEVTRLLDDGYIIVVARETPQTVQALSRLDRYPYKSLYIVRA
ncbi:MAG: DEAD/DEAH box helicase [Desulfurococcales archaeon]|nr:DEAD/DEAH box helicase [Desulfurococcales archaeon]